jgi:sec-independent protein translocase protein TatC
MFADIKPHLAELRKRLSLAVLSVVVAFVVAFTFHNIILTWITAPLNKALTEVGRIVNAQGKTTWEVQSSDANRTKVEVVAPKSAQEAAALKLEQAAKKALSLADEKFKKVLNEILLATQELKESITKLDKKVEEDSFDGQITTHQVGGAFFVALKVSFFAALLGAMPFILYQLWLFIAPGLYDNEKKMVTPFVVGGSVMFLIGVLFAYYVVTPFGFQFLITFGSFLYTPLINIEDYVGFFTKIMMGFGVAFELPVFAYTLGVMGMITDKSLKDFFKYAIVIIFILAALLTPPDILTQMLMAAPLIILYGFSIIILKYVNPHKEESDDEDEDDVHDEQELLENKK